VDKRQWEMPITVKTIEKLAFDQLRNICVKKVRRVVI